jgi:hypothetical protein
MNDIASIRKMGPLEPCGLSVASDAFGAPLTGFAAVDDFGVFFVEGKKRF